MSDSRHGILYTCTRTFFKSLSAIFGLGLGLIPVILMIGASFGDIDLGLEIKSYYSPTILPNAENIRKELGKEAPILLKVNITGVIGTENLNAQSIRQLLIEAKEGLLKNNRVKGVLLYINTPGGTVTDADGIYHIIQEFKTQNNIPVYAYVDGLCASGGMYVAAAADKVLASDVSLIGSIGVVLPPFFNFTHLLEKIGVDTKTLSAGSNKDEMNPFRPWKKDEGKALEAIVNTYYHMFVDIVATNRPNIDKEKLVNDYGARVFPAKEAQELGFIDENGVSIDEAVKQLAQASSLEEGKYQMIKLERKVTFSDLFKSESSIMTGSVTHKLSLPNELDPKLMNQFLYLYLPR